MTETVGTRSTTGILIIEARPTGLTMANLLARYGIDFRIVEGIGDDEPVQGTRDPRPHLLELWDKLGLADEALWRGQKFEEVDTLINGRPLTSGCLSCR